MKRFYKFVMKSFVSGLLIAVPMYLAVLLILKGLKSLAPLIRPLALWHPPGVSTEAAEHVMALIVAAMGCIALGAAIMTRPGQAVRERIERSVLEKIPGYVLVRGLMQQLAGDGPANMWKPALTEMANGLVFSFIIEEIDSGRYAIFVPSVPSPVVGSVYILPRQRVHPLDASFAQTFRTLSRWGSGARDLVIGVPLGQPDVTGQPESAAPKDHTRVA